MLPLSSLVGSRVTVFDSFSVLTGTLERDSARPDSYYVISPDYTFFTNFGESSVKSIYTGETRTVQSRQNNIVADIVLQGF